MVARSSYTIGYKGAQSLYYAKMQSERIGLGLNTLVTINFSLTSIPSKGATKAFGRLRTNHFGKWARRPRKGHGPEFAPTYSYWFENERDGVVFEEIGDDLPHNVHVQWYVHIPPKRHYKFKQELYEWLDFIAGDFCAENAIKVQQVMVDRGVTRYGLKGASLIVAKRFGASKLQSPQGKIIGRRTGTSVNIGPSARRAMDSELGIRRQCVA